MASLFIFQMLLPSPHKYSQLMLLCFALLCKYFILYILYCNLTCSLWLQLLGHNLFSTPIQLTIPAPAPTPPVTSVWVLTSLLELPYSVSQIAVYCLTVIDRYLSSWYHKNWFPLRISENQSATSPPPLRSSSWIIKSLFWFLPSSSHGALPAYILIPLFAKDTGNIEFETNLPQ